jgi:hypothetical protein|tara:strand:- start:585 stop:791 length:207 start_codon:yes stop_codon:yes gene_type:complete
MKHNYSVRKQNNEYSVIELKTNQVINRYELRDDANQIARFLESGGGFAGETPRFFVKNVVTLPAELAK